MLTRSSWIKIALIMVLCLVVCGGLFACSSGCTAAVRHAGNIANKAYEDVSFSERGDFSVPASEVRSLEINWAAGTVDVTVTEDEGEEPMVTAVEEINGPGRGSNRMTWQLRNGGLQIGYGMGSAGIAGCAQMGSKHLTLTLPKSLAQSLDSIDLNAASGSYNFDSISCKNLNANLASGAINGSRITAQQLDLDVASGTVELSGSFPQAVSLNLASGNVNIACEDVCPTRTSLDVMSGQVLMTVPESSGISARIDKLSGSFDCDIPGSWDLPDYKAFTCGDGSCSLDVSMTSGQVTLRSA